MGPHFNKFQTKKKSRKFRVRIYLALAGIFLFFTGIFYIVQLSPIFQIRDYNVSGHEYLTEAEVLKILGPKIITGKVRIFLGERNILSWNSGSPDISKTELAEARISRDWIRQSVDILIKERERLAIWCDSRNNCSWIDNNGTLFAKAPQVEGSLIMIVSDINSEYLPQGAKIYEERFIGNIIKILKSLKELHLATKKISFDSRLQEISVENYFGPNILFSIRFDPITNLDSLRSLMEKADLKKYKYIDLRVENRIYYKTL